MIEFPCVGSGDSTWTPSEADIDLWSRAYPAVHVDRELLQMQSWLQANPARRKTARGCSRFVVNWLSKAQNEARRILDNGRRPGQPMPPAFVPAPSGELRVAIERAVRAEHPEWKDAEIRTECAKRFNARWIVQR